MASGARAFGGGLGAAGARRLEAAQVLAALAALGVDGADPGRWPGLAPPSSNAPLHGPGQIPVLSPSRVDLLAKCPLAWALNKAGGSRQAGDRASLGTLIHQLAETYPEADPEAMALHLEERWPELGLADTYSSRRMKDEAKRMARRLGAYQAAHGLPEGSEVVIKPPGPAGRWRLPVRLAGQIDRLELAEDGRVRIVDFKTGANPPAVAEAATNPQLGAYQIAINAGLVPPYRAASEAALVYLSKGARLPTERRQPPLDQAENRQWMETLLTQCADDATGPTFEARTGPQCLNCAVKSSCPAWPQGKQVIA
ncbi:MAG: PD-(D/E)XK nuclease family protein [Bifidobacteriaceae bacterium]|nr:PD-(D/E)XK nuclease family protein [Bifidobacteriaceae bacterium]